MTLELANYALDEPYPLDMTTLTGESVVVVAAALDTEPHRVELRGSISSTSWDTVMATGAFHTDLEPDELIADDSSVEIVLVLRDPLAAALSGPEELIDALFGDEPTVLTQTEAWLLASALREVQVPDEPDASGSVGYRTRWARPLV